MLPYRPWKVSAPPEEVAAGPGEVRTNRQVAVRKADAGCLPPPVNELLTPCGNAGPQSKQGRNNPGQE